MEKQVEELECGHIVTDADDKDPFSERWDTYRERYKKPQAPADLEGGSRMEKPRKQEIAALQHRLLFEQSFVPHGTADLMRRAAEMLERQEKIIDAQCDQLVKALKELHRYRAEAAKKQK